MEISNDSLAIILLCTHLGLLPEPDHAPLTLKNWNPIALDLSRAGMRPGDLLGKSPREIGGMIAVSEQEVSRMAGLLGREESMSSELARLSSLGIWVLTRADGGYPERYRDRLGKSAPAVIFGAGEKALVGDPGIAVVGSRNVDQAGRELAEFTGSASAHNGLVVYSGGARGVDQYSMKAAVEGRGHAVGVLAHSLVKALRDRRSQRAVSGGNLTLVTPYSPYAGFSVGAAMGRNKLIYTLADYGLVIASDLGKGGTWSGANEVLKHEWVPLFVASGENVPEGNTALIEKGGIPFPTPFPLEVTEFRNWLEQQAAGHAPPAKQLDLI
jgi:predicted Rossmann fold nucleotide-binding protein DprA/Smf involved in DNA uptake